MTNLDQLLKDLNARINENPMVIGNAIHTIINIQSRLKSQYNEAVLLPEEAYRLMKHSTAIFNDWLIEIKVTLNTLINYKVGIAVCVTGYNSMSGYNPQLNLGTIQVDPIIGGNSPIPDDVDKFLNTISTHRFSLSTYDQTRPLPDIGKAVKEIAQLYAQLKGGYDD